VETRREALHTVKAAPQSTVTAFVKRFLARLRYPQLFLILGGLLVLDLVLPDPIPLVDEVLLAVLTLIAASLTGRDRDRPPPRDVTPQDVGGGRLNAGDDPPDRTTAAR
jgi:hypothetical protein